MCGIAGILRPQGNPEELIRRMTATLIHRGPDDEGYVCYDDCGGVALGHRRLSILDLSANGRQPMVSADGRYAIVFNGEIYNFEELKGRLLGRGVTKYRSGTDTEILLEHFAQFGVEATLRSAEGMFAIGLYDRKERALTLMRDRGGEKPLFYGWLGKSFVFASELKAIRAIDAKEILEIDPDAVKAFLKFAYIPQPRSIYKGIYKLIQGHYVTIRAPFEQLGPVVPYWHIETHSEKYAGLSYEEAKETLKELIRGSVRRQMVTDVPYGAFLSGGIDSSLITAVMQECSSRPVRTFTIGFHDAEYNEAEYAKRIAQALGCDHTERYFSAGELLEYVPRMAEIYDEPMADASQLPTNLLSRTAREKVTVCLTGDCGDELFFGYPYYAIIRDMRRMFPRSIHGLAGALMKRMWPLDERFFSKGCQVANLYGDRFWSNTRGSYYFRNGIDLRLEEDSVLALKERVLPEADPIRQLKAWDFYTYMSDSILCKVDRAAMAHSLETRVPLLNPEIIELAMSLPNSYEIQGNQLKRILRDILSDYIPRELFERPKMGFGVPIHRFLRNELKDWAEEYIYDEKLYARFPFINKAGLQELWEKFKREPGRNGGTEFWRFCLLRQWVDTQGNERKFPPKQRIAKNI